MIASYLDTHARVMSVELFVGGACILLYVCALPMCHWFPLAPMCMCASIVCVSCVHAACAGCALMCVVGGALPVRWGNAGGQRDGPTQRQHGGINPAGGYARAQGRVRSASQLATPGVSHWHVGGGGGGRAGNQTLAGSWARTPTNGGCANHPHNQRHACYAGGGPGHKDTHAHHRIQTCSWRPMRLNTQKHMCV